MINSISSTNFPFNIDRKYRKLAIGLVATGSCVSMALIAYQIFQKSSAVREFYQKSKVFQYFKNTSCQKVQNCSQKILKLVISNDHMINWNISGYPIFFTYEAFIETSEEQIPIYFFNHNLSYKYDIKLLDNKIMEGYENLDILIKDNNSDIYLSEQLTDNFKSNLLKFLKEGRKDPTYCCIDFFQDMLNIKRQAVNQNFLKQYKIIPFQDEDSLTPETGIIIYNGREIVHWAIYLGFGLYISLAGKKGPLLLSDLIQLRKIYQANKTAILEIN